MNETTTTKEPKILILATLSGGYAGADYVGQQHLNYSTNTSILPVRCPSMFSTVSLSCTVAQTARLKEALSELQ